MINPYYEPKTLYIFLHLALTVQSNVICFLTLAAFLLICCSFTHVMSGNS